MPLRADGFVGIRPWPSASPKLPAAETLTFLFTDIEGSTEKLARLGDNYKAVLTDHHRIIRECLAAHEGREVVTAGDGFFAVFDSPSACIAAVIEMQRQLASHEWPESEQVRVRMGVHTGEAASEEAVGLVGLDVNKAARIAAVGHGGQVLVSEATATLVRDLLKESVVLRDLGTHRLKDLSTPEELYQLEADGLEADFPPIRSLDNPELKHNLPVELTSFIGRANELKELNELVGTSRLVTLVGAGGCGKTRLALQVAADLLDGLGEGVWFVDLGPLSDQDLVASTVASVFHIREEAARPVTEQLYERLRDRQLLVVLDNCEHVIDACAKLADGLLRACPGVHVLATSREPLGLTGEHVYPVPSLSFARGDNLTDGSALSSDAVQLFYDRARTQRPNFVLDEKSLPSVISICAHLDGIPLAIELAAARLRSLSLIEIEGRLGDRFRLLTGGSRAALPRHQTLRAAVDWSYESLNQRDRAVFDRLAVFAGGFDLPLAEAVCACEQVEDFEVMDALGSLVDKSLVQADWGGQGVRYNMLETIRQYGAEKLSSNKLDAASAREAHSRAFLELASSAFSDRNSRQRREWVTRFQHDRENLVAAVRHLAEVPDRATDAVRMGRHLGWFWTHVGPVSVGIDLIQTALEHEGAADKLEVARAVAELAWLYVAAGRLSEARTQIEDGVARAELLGDASILAQLLLQEAGLAYTTGDHSGADRLAEEAARLSRELGDDVNVAYALRTLGMCAASPAAAHVCYEEALRLFRQSGHAVGELSTLNDIGMLELKAGALGHARDVFEQVTRGATDIGDVRMYAVSLSNLSLVYLGTGELDRACAVTAEALVLAAELGLGADVPYCVLGAALCATASGRSIAAAQLHGAAAVIMKERGQAFEPLEEDYRIRDLAALREKLGVDELEANFELGRRMNLEEATALARNVTTTDDSVEPGV